jgi:hypothetical protein
MANILSQLHKSQAEPKNIKPSSELLNFWRLAYMLIIDNIRQFIALWMDIALTIYFILTTLKKIVITITIVMVIALAEKTPRSLLLSLYLLRLAPEYPIERRWCHPSSASELRQRAVISLLSMIVDFVDDMKHIFTVVLELTILLRVAVGLPTLSI